MSNKNIRRYYFDYNGRRIEHGTIVKLNLGSGIVDVTFLFWTNVKDSYMFKVNNAMCKDGYYLISYNYEQLIKRIVEITDRVDGFWNPHLCPPRKGWNKSNNSEDFWFCYIVFSVIIAIFIMIF